MITNNKKPQKLIGHRVSGSNTWQVKNLGAVMHPENTVAAVEELKKKGINWVEFDVTSYLKEETSQEGAEVELVDAYTDKVSIFLKDQVVNQRPVVTHDKVPYTKELPDLRDILRIPINKNIEVKADSLDGDFHVKFVMSILREIKAMRNREEKEGIKPEDSQVMLSTFSLDVRHTLTFFQEILYNDLNIPVFWVFDAETLDFYDIAPADVIDKSSRIVFDCELFPVMKEFLDQFDEVYLYGDKTNEYTWALEYSKHVDGLIVDTILPETKQLYEGEN